jgi:signal transduction histidine kinase
MNKSRLSFRLLIAAAVSIFVAVALTGFAINFLFNNYSQNQLGIELKNELRSVTSSVGFDEDGNLFLDSLKNERYLETLSGHYWQVTTQSGQALHSKSLWDQTLPIVEQDYDGFIQVSKIRHLETEFLVSSWWVQLVNLDNEHIVNISVARDLAETQNATSTLKKNTALWLATLAMALTIAAWFQTYFGLKPLSEMRAEVRDLKVGNISQLSDSFPLEIQPLVDEVNSTLKSKDQLIERARFSAGNLAHGLKTPLTIINGLLTELSKENHGGLTNDIREQIGKMNEIIERELASARINAKSQKWTKVGPSIHKLLQTMKRLPGGEQIDWQTCIDSTFKMPVDDYDLAELAGNILDNARKYTKSEVLITGKWLNDQSGAFSVEDDGQGIPSELVLSALKRGERLHNSSLGHGIGFSIVRELAAANDCKLDLSSSELGGLKVTIQFDRN